MGAACRYILLIFSVWVWSVSPRSSMGQTLKENWYSSRQAKTTECEFVNNEPVACCNSSDYGMCIANLNPNVNGGKCSPVPRTKTTKTKSPIEEFRKSKKKQNKNKVNGTRNKRQHENKMGKSSKQKVKTRIKLMKILKDKKVEEMSSEKDKRMRKEDKQLPPKICPGPCVCDFEFMVKMKKLKTKHRVAVRKLYRIQAWWNLLKFGKQYKAKGDTTIVPKKEPTFSIPFGFLSSATNGATTCGCSSLSSHPNNNNITSIYNQLKNCTRTATWACSTEDITLTKDMRKNLCTNCSTIDITLTKDIDKNYCTDCSSSVCVQSDTNCAANKSYITSCKPLWKNFTLTQEMVTHIEDFCLPQLNAWISRYRSCGSCKTYGDCVYSCQSDANLYNCQSRSCDIDKLCGVNNNCIFETCLKNATNGGLDNSGCMCDCYKALENVGPLAQFPINQTRVGNMTCYQMNAFERLVYTRRNRCLNPGGITEDNNDGLGVDLQDYTGGPFPLVPGLKTSAPSVKDRLSGNFVDCRFQGRQAFEWIYECSKPCCTSTSSSTIPSATSFSPSTSSSSTATTTVTISTKTITSTTTAIYASTTTSKTNTASTASTASTTKTSTTSSTSTTTATISTTTSTKTSTTTPTTTTTTTSTSTATISTTTSITTSTTTTTPTTTTTTTSTTTPTTTTTTTTSTTTTTTTTT